MAFAAQAKLVEDLQNKVKELEVALAAQAKPNRGRGRPGPASTVVRSGTSRLLAARSRADPAPTTATIATPIPERFLLLPAPPLRPLPHRLPLHS